MANIETEDKKKTFTIQITHTQNATWQGTIRYVEGSQVINFRSALEMIKLIDSVVSE